MPRRVTRPCNYLGNCGRSARSRRGNWKNRVCVAIALFDQNSDLPTGDDAASTSLLEFLKRIRYGRVSRSRIASLAVGVTLCCLLIATLAGVWFAAEYNYVVIKSLPIAPEGKPYPRYSGWGQAWAWSVSALLTFGFPVWWALRYRQRGLARGSRAPWVGFYDWKQWPPLEKWLLLFAKLAMTVFIILFIYRMATTFSVGLESQGSLSGTSSPLAKWLAWVNLKKQIFYSVPFALAAAVNAMFVLAIADMDREKLSSQVAWLLPMIHVIVMAAVGYLAADFLVVFAGDNTNLLPLRKKIFVAEFASIAFLSALTVWVFTRGMVLEDEHDRQQVQTQVAVS